MAEAAAGGKGFPNPLAADGSPAEAQAAPPTARALREAGSATDGMVYACFFVPGRQLLAVGGVDKRLTLHSLEDPGVKTVVVERTAVVAEGTVSRDDSILCVGDLTRWVGLFDVARLLASEEPLREARSASARRA